MTVVEAAVVPRVLIGEGPRDGGCYLHQHNLILALPLGLIHRSIGAGE